MSPIYLLSLIFYYTLRRHFSWRLFFAALSAYWAHVRQRSSCCAFGKTIYFSHWEQVATPILEWVRGLYEFPIAQEGLVIDCGANIGMLGLLFREVLPNLKVEAYEPHPEVFKLLQLNHAKPGAAYQAAISTKDGYAELQLDRAACATGSTLCTNTGAATVRVATRSLASLLSKQKVDLLKIDIEGFEFELLGDEAIEFQNVHYLYLEVHPNSTRCLSALIERLEKNFRLRFFSDYRPAFGFKEFSNLVIYGEQLGL